MQFSVKATHAADVEKYRSKCTNKRSWRESELDESNPKAKQM